MRNSCVIFLLGCGLGLVSPVFAASTFERVDWESWSFSWEIRDDAGIAIRDIRYQGTPVLSKASMPVIRVKYVREYPWWHPYSWFGLGRSSGRCGPFEDRISWNNLRAMDECGNRKACLESYTLGGTKWLEVGGYARIGAYHLYQAWLFSEDGQILPVLHSRGLSCTTDHDHHPYWRLNFDLSGRGDDQVFVYNEGAPDEGWGPGWHKYTNELDTEKNPATNRIWFVRDQPTGNAVWVLPGPGYSPLRGDGAPDKFSNLDVAVRVYRPEEDVPWEFGARGELEYNDGEGIQEKDVVFWYVAHLHHEARLALAKWLTVGPILRVQLKGQ
jgi:hypothetical protein